VESGGLKVATAGAANALFSVGLVKHVFARLPVPMTVWTKERDDGVHKMFVDKANEFVEKTSKKLTEKVAKSAANSAIGSGQKPKVQERNTLQAGLVDDVPIEQMFLLYFAIVNMNRGIGHGW
jgi:hypothetical protein